MALPPIGDLFRRTLATYRRRLVPILKTYMITAAAAVGIGFVAVVMVAPAVFVPPLLVVPIVGAFVALVILGFVAQSMSLEAALHDGMKWREAFARARKDWSELFWAGLITNLLLAGAALLFLVPAVILLPAANLMAYAFKVEGKRGADALLRAHALVRGRWWKTLVRWVLFLVPFILVSLVLDAVLPVSETAFVETIPTVGEWARLVLDLGIAFFVAGPLSLVFGGELYRDLKASAPHNADAAVSRKKWFAIAGAGWALVLGLLLLYGAIIVSLLVHLSDAAR